MGSRSKFWGGGGGGEGGGGVGTPKSTLGKFFIAFFDANFPMLGGSVNNSYSVQCKISNFGWSVNKKFSK